MNGSSEKLIQNTVQMCLDIQAPAIIVAQPEIIGYMRIDHALRDAGCFVSRVDISPIHTKEELLEALYHNCDFPGYFGFNWDALDECLTDFHWRHASGYILIYRQPQYLFQPDLQKFIGIINYASQWWSQKNISLKLLIPIDAVDENILHPEKHT